MKNNPCMNKPQKLDRESRNSIHLSKCGPHFKYSKLPKYDFGSTIPELLPLLTVVSSYTAVRPLHWPNLSGQDP